MNEKCDILIIGGGVIGMSCAYELSLWGAKVVVMDKGEPGHGCSYGNAGWLTPCFSMPLPMPGMFFKSVKWLLDPDSPLRIKPELSWNLVRWLTRFLVSMNEKQASLAISSLTALSKYSLESYAKLNERFPGAFDFNQKGLLMISATQDGLDSAVQEMELVARHGVPGSKLSEAEIKALEPAIKARLIGGVFFPKEAHVEPLKVVHTLQQAAQTAGAQVISRAEVYDFEVQDRKIITVKTTAGNFHPEQVVLATGSWSTAIARTLDLRVPVLGGKGYSIVMKPFQGAPTHPIMIVERKIAVTPHSGSLRLAGTLELVNETDDSISPRRLENIVRGSREYLQLPQNLETLEIWRGLRPCTPDGVPVIGRPARYKNLVIAAGHQMLGLQSSLGTGRLVTDLIQGGTPSFSPYPFRADRF